MKDSIQMAAEIVAAYVASNHVQADELPELIAAVKRALDQTSEPAAEQPEEKPVPHMPIKKTITPDYLVSLEDQQHYKTLKRHLAGRGLTPSQYRAKWGLPLDYPMVAPNYSAQRSELARSLGLGRQSAARKGSKGKKAKPAQ